MVMVTDLGGERGVKETRDRAPALIVSSRNS